MQQAGQFETSGFISHRTRLEQINDAISKMRSGEAIHTLIKFGAS
jgi:Zn-dependent alcohol dehydrogenase